MIHWQAMKVGDLIDCGEANLQTGPFGTQLKASEYVESGIPVINVKNIGYGNVDPTSLDFVDEKTAERLQVHRLRAGDIVFGRKGSSDRHALIDKLADGWVQGSDCMRLRLNSKRVNPRFLSHYFQTSGHKYWMDAVCSFGATMSTLNQGIVRRISLQLPGIKAQEKIAAILSAYDELIENNKRRIALLEKMAEEIYREWFVRRRFPGHERAGKVKGVPEGWRRYRFSDLCQFQKGKTPDHLFDEKVEGGLPYINVEYLEGQDPQFVVPRRNSVVANEGDVLMLMDGARSGLVFRGKRGVVGSTLALIGVGAFYRDIVFEFLRAANEQIVANNTGSAIPHASKEFVNRLILTLPLEEDIIRRFGSYYSALLDQATVLKGQNLLSTRTRGLLLPRLISGKLSGENLDIQFPPGMMDEMKEGDGK